MSKSPRLKYDDARLQIVKGDILESSNFAKLIVGQDVIISAIGPSHEMGNHHILVDAAQVLIAAAKTTNVKRVIIVGGAGSLEIAPGVRLVDTPEFPAAWKSGALAHADALDILRASDINWTFFSPAAMIAPGERTGKYRTGHNQLLVDGAGQSRISAEDYTVALLDEVEHPKFVRQRFTVAY